MREKSIFNLLIKLLKDKKISISILFMIQILSGSIPVLIIWANGYLIDSIINLKNLNLVTNFKPIFLIAAFVAFLISINEIITLWQYFFSEYFQDLIYQRIFVKLLEAVSNYPNLDIIENPEIYNKVILAKDNAKAISEYISIGSNLFVLLFSITSSLLLSLMIAWWIPFILFFSMLPFVYYKTKILNETWQMKEKYAENFKFLDLYDDILTNPLFAKEIRMYKFQTYILKKWLNIYNEYLNIVNKVRKKGSATLFIGAFFSAIGPMIAYSYVAIQTIKGEITLGNLSYLFGIIYQLNSSLVGLMYNSSDIIKVFLASKPLIELLSYSPPHLKEPSYINTSSVFKLENLSFAYPGSSKDVLQNLNLEIKKGEKLAIIGKNGSGKTTLVKLLCGFYPPSKGNIYWKGQNINSIDPNLLRSEIGTMFQDFSHFPLSLKENIALEQDIDWEKIKEVLDKVGLDFLTDPNIILTKLVKGGRELSGGEWQKIALARLILNKKEFLVLDEPSSAIDPLAEYELLSLIQELTKQTTSIIISHRLSLCSIVDRIIVLDKGNIVEEGSHEELIGLKGKYHNMLKKQLSYYKK